MIKETEALSLRTQSANTKRLTERLHDINFWKAELQREISDIISETDLLCQQKLRLENAFRATEIPLHIATDNLHRRQRRQGIDLVQDEVELTLLKVRCPQNLIVAPGFQSAIPLFQRAAIPNVSFLTLNLSLNPNPNPNPLTIWTVNIEDLRNSCFSE